MITWQDVHGHFDFMDIYDQAVQEARSGDTLVEVGTWFGRSALYMAEAIKNSGKDLRFYVVDHWQRYPENEHLYQPNAVGIDADLIRKHGSQFQVFAHFLEQSGLSEYVRVMRMSSVAAAGHFGIGSCRMVFIDGGHSFEACHLDLLSWCPKVKPLGIFAGHDYPSWNGVKDAVLAFFAREQLEVRGNSWFARRP